MMDVSMWHGKSIDVEIEVLENRLREQAENGYLLNDITRMVFNSRLEKLMRLRLINAYAKANEVFIAYRNNVKNISKEKDSA